MTCKGVTGRGRGQPASARGRFHPGLCHLTQSPWPFLSFLQTETKRAVFSIMNILITASFSLIPSEENAIITVIYTQCAKLTQRMGGRRIFFPLVPGKALCSASFPRAERLTRPRFVHRRAGSWCPAIFCVWRWMTHILAVASSHRLGDGGRDGNRPHFQEPRCFLLRLRLYRRPPSFSSGRLVNTSNSINCCSLFRECRHSVVR